MKNPAQFCVQINTHEFYDRTPLEMGGLPVGPDHRRISTLGGSLRDVQLTAGHSALGTTQRYIEGSDEAKQRVVELV